MNKMNLPAPFGQITPTPPMVRGMISLMAELIKYHLLIHALALRCGGSLFSVSDLRPGGQEFDLWPVHLRCIFGQNTEFSQCLSLPRCIDVCH